MAVKGKKTYAELLRELNRLKQRVEDLEAAAKISGRELIGYAVDRWVSIPIPDVQQHIIRDEIADILLHGKEHSRRQLGDVAERRFEAVVKKVGLLAEYRAYLARFRTAEFGHCFEMQIWGLVPV